jgi:hypothetical protein
MAAKQPKAPPDNYWRSDSLWGRKHVKGREFRWSLPTEMPEHAPPRSFSFDRPRLRRKPLDPQATMLLEDCRSEMAEILKRKKVPDDEAKSAVERALEIAARHQLERSRRDRYLENQEEATQGRERLFKHVERIAWAISRLTPTAQAELNRIMIAMLRPSI